MPSTFYGMIPTSSYTKTDVLVPQSTQAGAAIGTAHRSVSRRHKGADIDVVDFTRTRSDPHGCQNRGLVEAHCRHIPPFPRDLQIKSSYRHSLGRARRQDPSKYENADDIGPWQEESFSRTTSDPTAGRICRLQPFSAKGHGTAAMLRGEVKGPSANTLNFMRTQSADKGPFSCRLSLPSNQDTQDAFRRTTSDQHGARNEEEHQEPLRQRTEGEGQMQNKDRIRPKLDKRANNKTASQSKLKYVIGTRRERAGNAEEKTRAGTRANFWPCRKCARVPARSKGCLLHVSGVPRFAFSLVLRDARGCLQTCALCQVMPASQTYAGPKCREP